MPQFLERAIVPLTDGLVAGFFFILAANFGSFLNVVVHRWPRGESVVRGGSRCPACGSAIRWYDNVPVLGWLWLRGRCRDCRSPISPRYPVVEAACAVLLGTVASVELLTGGGNLPTERFDAGRWGIDSLLMQADGQLIAVCLLHCFILATLLAWAVLDFDGQTVPAAWLAAATLAVVATAVLLPAVLPVAVGFPFSDRTPTEGRWRGGIASAAGIAVGSVLGAGAGNRAVRCGLVLLAAGLGWQAAVGAAVLTVVVAAARHVPRMLAAGVRHSFRVAASDLVVAAGLHVLLWKPIHHLWVVVSQLVAAVL